MRQSQVRRKLPMPPDVDPSKADVPSSTSEWLESPLLARIVKRVAGQYGILPAEVDDLIQEVRIALWEAEPPVEIKPKWIFVTASHKAVDILRRRWQTGSDAVLSKAVAGGAQELSCLVRAQVALLPKNLRAFCDLRYAEGMTEREIAGRMGLCRASVRWLGVRFLKALADGP
jgi:RNA polymerase sigma factor (sigma-70 family)